MWPASDHFFETLLRSHDRVCYIDILKDGDVVETITGNDLASLFLVDGSVQVSRQTIRRSATIQLADSTGAWVPRTTDDLLAPFVTEMRVWVGAKYWDAPIPALAEYQPNLLIPPNDTFESGIGGWATTVLLSNISGVPTRVTSQAHTGDASMEIKSLASGTMSVQNTVGPPVTAGTVYSATAWCRAVVSARIVQVGIAWINSVGATLSISYGTGVLDAGWVQASVTDAAPANAVEANIVITVNSTGAANELHDVDDLSLTLGRVNEQIAVLQPDSEFVPVGTFVITGASSNLPRITLQGYDRAWYLSNFPGRFVIPKNTNVTDAVLSLLGNQVPTQVLDTNLPDTEDDTPALSYDANTSSTVPYETLASTASWMLYADPMGTFTAIPEPAIEDDPELIVQAGSSGWLTHRPQRNLGDQDPKNAVVYTGEGGSNPNARGFAQDDNPASFTYVNRIGVRPVFMSSPVLKTNDACGKAARTHLQKILGVANTYTVTIMPNAAVEAGDVWLLVDESQNISEGVITDAFTVALRSSAGDMEVTCRANVIRGSGEVEP